MVLSVAPNKRVIRNLTVEIGVLVLLTCYGTKMPNDFSPEVIRTRKSSDAVWKLNKAPATSMPREFCWPKLGLNPTCSLFSQEGVITKLTKRTNVCAWLVAWVFMIDRKSIKFASPAEMAAQITSGGKKKLPRFMVLAQSARQFLFAPICTRPRVEHGHRWPEDEHTSGFRSRDCCITVSNQLASSHDPRQPALFRVSKAPIPKIKGQPPFKLDMLR